MSASQIAPTLREQVESAMGAWVDNPLPPATANGYRYQIRRTHDGRYIARFWHPKQSWCIVTIGPWSGDSDVTRFFGVSPVRSVEQERYVASVAIASVLQSALAGAVR